MHMLDKILLCQPSYRQKAGEIHNIRWQTFSSSYMRRNYNKHNVVQAHRLVKGIPKNVPLNTVSNHNLLLGHLYY